MRLMQIIGSKGGGGAENFYLRLTEALHQAGDEVLAVLPPTSRIASALDHEVPRRSIKMRGAWDLWARWQINRAIREFRPDIVQTWMGRPTRLVHLPNGKKPVHVARLGGYYALKDYRHAHAWVGNTRSICDYLVKHGLPASRVFHIGNFVEAAPAASETDKAATREKFGIPPDALLIVAAGRLHPNKGFADLLQACAALPPEIGQRPLRLLIAGDGALGLALRQQAEALSITPRLIWAGWQADIGPLLDAADLFVCPSRHEPLGNVILEAWAHRLPVISTATDGARELITPDHDGLIVPCADADAIAAGLRQILALSDSDRASLAATATSTLERTHGKAMIVQAYRELYGALGVSCAA